MRFVVTATWDMDAGNALAKAGTLGSTVQAILEDLKPEATYFVANEGQRTAIMIMNLDEASQMPAVAEPWFLALKARLQFQPAMRPEDLAKAGPDIEAAAKKYA